MKERISASGSSLKNVDEKSRDVAVVALKSDTHCLVLNHYNLSGCSNFNEVICLLHIP
jgi:hypothetical protein